MVDYSRFDKLEVNDSDEEEISKVHQFSRIKSFDSTSPGTLITIPWDTTSGKENIPEKGGGGVVGYCYLTPLMHSKK